MKNWVIQGALFFIGFIAVERFCHKQTQGFQLQKIQADLPHNSDWETLLPGDHTSQRLQTILSQPYSFLNSGGESYAFVSKDGKYVLKFFKLHHMRPKSFADKFLPYPLRAKYQKSRIQKLTALFSSCKLAYERFRQGTGLVYLHLNKTDFLHVKLQLFDAIGVLHSPDLDQLSFALQEKAVMAFPTLSALAEVKELEAAKTRLSALIDLIVARCQAGLSDHDPRQRNFGFVGEKAIEIDLGSFTIDETLKIPSSTNKILLYETLKLRRYINKYHPELSDFLEEKINNKLTKGT